MSCPSFLFKELLRGTLSGEEIVFQTRYLFLCYPNLTKTKRLFEGNKTKCGPFSQSYVTTNVIVARDFFHAGCRCSFCSEPWLAFYSSFPFFFPSIFTLKLIGIRFYSINPKYNSTIAIFEANHFFTVKSHKYIFVAHF